MPLIPWPASADDSSKGKDIEKDIATKAKDLFALAGEIPPEYFSVAAFAAGSLSLAASYFVHKRYFRRIPNAEWVSPNHLARKRWIKGRVTSVGDNDNFRFYHTPGIGWRWPLKFRRVPTLTKELKDQTIHVRIAGIDAPENAHFGRPAQPYAQEALAYLRARILGKTVFCQLIRRDQYGRVVSHVRLAPRFLPATLFRGPNLAEDMLRKGWATTYEQHGAEYGEGGVERYKQVEQEAKDARRGIWAKGVRGETPAEYKRRYAQAADGGEPPPKARAEKEQKKGWLRRLFSRK
ncbi:staphylococcal nuclease [Schizophyllum commune Tattone D]|nr:staphylococcal nuclease [Schizophyllum commune Tattone D]